MGEGERLLFIASISLALIVAVSPSLGGLAVRSKWSLHAHALAVGIAVSGGALQYAGLLTDPRAFVPYLMPLLVLLVLRPAFALFVRAQGRMPVDVYMNFQKGLFWDRVFTITMFLLVIGALLVLIPRRA